MKTRFKRLAVFAALAGGSWLVMTSGAVPQVPQGGRKVVPKLVPIAETRLLMEGLAHANFRGLDRQLKALQGGAKPADDQAWTFARGQALLIAETANLLMLRPPRNQGESAWFERAMAMRSAAAQLAQTISKRDYQESRAGLVNLANACNRCHQTFRVKVQVVPFDDNQPAP